MSSSPHRPSPIEEQGNTDIQHQLLDAAHRVDVSRRSVVSAFMAAAGAAVLFGAPHRAFAASATKETLDALASAEEQLNAIQTQLDALAAEFEALSVEQDKTLSRIEDVQAQIDTTQKKIDATQKQIEEKEAELDVKQGILSERVSDSYKKGPLSSLTLLLSSESFDELLSNSRYVDKINEADRRMITEIQAIRDELETKKAELEAEKGNLETQKADLETLKAAQDAQLEEMRAKQAEIKQVIDGLSKDVKDLMAKRDAEYLAAVQEEERQRQAAAGGGVAVAPTGNITGAPQSLERVLSAAHATPSPGVGLCAMWVSMVFNNAGFNYPGGNANDQYNWWCTSSDRGALKPGMIIATPSHPHSAAGMVYGHVGIYMGNGTVMDNVGYVRSIGVDEWISYYGPTVTPRWGWVFGAALA